MEKILLKKITEPKENKNRIKRLAQDKKTIKQSIEFLYISFPLQTIENKETIEFIKEIESKVESLRTELLTELENL